MYVCLEDKGEINNVIRFTRGLNYNGEGLFMLLRKPTLFKRKSAYWPVQLHYFCVK